jgi:hypothetical protein
MVRRSPVSSPVTSLDRGNARLLWDCATVGRVLEADRPPARDRLATELGEPLTGLLLRTLREASPSTPHEEELWRAAQDVA